MLGKLSEIWDRNLYRYLLLPPNLSASFSLGQLINDIPVFWAISPLACSLVYLEVAMVLILKLLFAVTALSSG